MHANKREEIAQVYAGDIAAAVGLKSVATGDTICDPKHPVVLESMEFPKPVITLAIEPKTKADQEKLGQGLAKLTSEDPTFQVRTDDETGQVVISGMGELHLEIIVDRLRREFGVMATVGRPQVAYRETLTKHGDAEVHVISEQPLLDFWLDAHAQRRMQAGKILARGVQQIRQVLTKDHARCADANGLSHAAPDFFADRIEVGKKGPDKIIKLLTGGRQLEGAALEERGAKVVFQLNDLRADGRLLDAVGDVADRTGNALVFGDVVK